MNTTARTATLVTWFSIDDDSPAISQAVKVTVTAEANTYRVSYSDLFHRPVDGLTDYEMPFRTVEDALSYGLYNALTNVSAIYRERIEDERTPDRPTLESPPLEVNHYTTITDLYRGLLDREPNTPRTMEELRDIVQHESTRYEDITQEWWSDLFDSGWPFGDVTPCAYCGESVPLSQKPGNEPENDRLWAFIGFSHHENCEWVRTRAHRRPAMYPLRWPESS